MTNQGLQYYIHDESDGLRFELAGSLSKGGAQSVYQAWQTALSILGDRTTIIDISFVSDADAYGSALLALWHRNGARIIAASPQSRALAEPIIGEAVPAPLPSKSWFQRLKAMISVLGLGCHRNYLRGSLAFRRSCTPCSPPT
jgi:ABC-type transporter Mla MlaB component